MKRVLYTLPAVMIWLFYGMLALLAGGFASFQIRAWLVILLPAMSALLLLAGRWWGCIPGMLLGGLLISMGLTAGNTAFVAAGIGVFAYYLVMGLLCLRSEKK